MKNILILIAVAGFLVIGLLLATNHPGQATRVTSVVFFYLCITTGVHLLRKHHDEK